jgi:hypothetical protein
MISLENLIKILLKLLPTNIQPTMINQTNKKVSLLNLILFQYSFEIGHDMKLENFPYSNGLEGFAENAINKINHVRSYGLGLAFVLVEVFVGLFLIKYILEGLF